MSTITLAQAVRNCVEIERGAERYYRGLVESSEDEEVKAFFFEMAEQERQHAKWILDLGERLEAGKLPQRADAKIGSIEVAPGWSDVEGISLAQAVSIALEAENSAALYYDAMTDFTTGTVKELFEDLARTEEQHAEKLRAFQAERFPLP